MGSEGKLSCFVLLPAWGWRGQKETGLGGWNGHSGCRQSCEQHGDLWEHCNSDVHRLTGARPMFRSDCIAQAGALSWLEHRRINQKFAGSILGQGTYLGCGFGPYERQPINVSLPLSLLPLPSL